MDAELVDALRHAFPWASSRRGVLVGLVGNLLVAPALPLGVEAKARNKRKRKRKGKKNQEPPSPPSPPPLPAGAGRCDAVSPISDRHPSFWGFWAQTFLPPRGGHLTNAEIFLTQNAANLFVTLQIRTVDSAGTPGNTILAHTELFVEPATNPDVDLPRRVVGAFSNPPQLTLGQPYALAVRCGFHGQETVHLLLFNERETCPDGQLFLEDYSIGGFDLADLGTGVDLVYAVTMRD